MTFDSYSSSKTFIVHTLLQYDMLHVLCMLVLCHRNTGQLRLCTILQPWYKSVTYLGSVTMLFTQTSDPSALSSVVTCTSVCNLCMYSCYYPAPLYVTYACILVTILHLCM